MSASEYSEEIDKINNWIRPLENLYTTLCSESIDDSVASAQNVDVQVAGNAEVNKNILKLRAAIKVEFFILNETISGKIQGCEDKFYKALENSQLKNMLGPCGLNRKDKLNFDQLDVNEPYFSEIKNYLKSKYIEYNSIFELQESIKTYLSKVETEQNIVIQTDNTVELLKSEDVKKIFMYVAEILQDPATITRLPIVDGIRISKEQSGLPRTICIMPDVEGKFRLYIMTNSKNEKGEKIKVDRESGANIIYKPAFVYNPDTCKFDEVARLVRNLNPGNEAGSLTELQDNNQKIMKLFEGASPEERKYLVDPYIVSPVYRHDVTSEKLSSHQINTFFSGGLTTPDVVNNAPAVYMFPQKAKCDLLAKFNELGELKKNISDDRPQEGYVKLFSDVLMGLGVIHKLNMVYGDLKFNNVLVFDDKESPPNEIAKISDFDTLKSEGEILKPGEIRGTNFYYPQEKQYGFPVTKAQDMYSFGVLLYTAATFVEPYSYHPQPNPSDSRKIRTETFKNFPLIPLLLADNPDFRPNVEETKCLFAFLYAQNHDPEIITGVNKFLKRIKLSDVEDKFAGLYNAIYSNTQVTYRLTSKMYFDGLTALKEAINSCEAKHQDGTRP